MNVRKTVLASVVVMSAGLAALAGPAIGVDGEATVRFTAAGDYGTTSATNAVLDRIASESPDLNLALGDLSYGATGQEQAWCDLVTSRVEPGFPFELLSGNHESNGLNGNINDFSACLPNQMPGLVGTYGRQWYVDVPREAPLVRFIMISPALTFPDGVWSYAQGTPRYNWTAAAIDGARTADVPWVVVGMHKPCLSLGQYTCEIGADLANMLMAKKVDLVLSGHEHGYQRTKQLGLRQGCSALVPGTFNASCVADSDGDMLRGQGTVFATVGTGGTPLRDMNASDSEAGYFGAWSALNNNPSYGVLSVTATSDQFDAHFAPAGTGTFADAFTIRRGTPPANQPPVAAFTSSVSGLTASFDASGSSDPEGATLAYAWDFGDGTFGTGMTPSHTFTAAGDYTARLTVTDDQTASNSVTHVVTVTAPGQPAAFVTDTFNRSVANGLGSADLGGAWSTQGSATNFSVSPSAAAFNLRTAGTQVTGFLGATARSDTDLRLTIASDKPATGGGLYTYLVGRRVSTNNEYSARVRLASGGGIGVALMALKGSATVSTVQSEVILPGVSYTPGMQLLVRLQVTGTNPTTVRVKVWPSTASEPTAWLRSATDTAAGLQASGAVGLTTYLSSSATNAPVVLRLTDLSARPTG